MPDPTEQQILDALQVVKDPDLHKSIVDLGFVQHLRVCDGIVAFTIVLTTPACPVKEQLKAEAQAAVMALPGIKQVNVEMDATVSKWQSKDMGERLKGVKNILLVSSAKGGVGKSTVAANMAVALAQTGATVGLLDADIYGPSVPILFGLEGPPVVLANRIQPFYKFGVKLMSIGFLITEEQAVIWRGPMVMRALTQFFDDVEWGDLDYLVLDLPPGTGDAQLTIAQSLDVAGALIVTTPQDVAFADVRRGIAMFQQTNINCLGIIENMAYFVCPKCGEPTEIFHPGRRKKARAEVAVPFLARIPLDPAIADATDEGIPIVVRDPKNAQSGVFRDLAGQVVRELAKAQYRESVAVE
ncbi:MAG: Mrp/NBP35 family ATP-binding protein [bacterium]